MKKLILALCIIIILAVPVIAAQKIYVLYDKINPFDGFIHFTGKMDTAKIPDGSTLKERLAELLIKYPNTGYKLYPNGTLPNPEAVKYDQVTETLIPLEPGDITPKVQTAINKALKEIEIADYFPNWPQVKNAINNISSLTGIKAFLLKLSRIVYWNTKNKLN